MLDHTAIFQTMSDVTPTELSLRHTLVWHGGSTQSQRLVQAVESVRSLGVEIRDDLEDDLLSSWLLLLLTSLF